MFKRQPNPSFKVDVEITKPGQKIPDVIEFEFKQFTRKKYFEFFEEQAGKQDVETLPLLVLGWSKIDVPYSAEELACLLDDYPSAAQAIFQKFRDEHFEARRKN